jgi:XTP/dITP diphosphohydrolase
MPFVLATANAHKAEEIYTVFTEAELVGRPAAVPAIAETADSLVGNALLKAQAIARFTGQPAIADDTGLEVDACRDILGIQTARFAPDAVDYRTKMESLLDLLADIPGDQRSARFATVALAYFPDGRIVKAEGQLAGHITRHIHGSNGFGYDPIFVPDGFCQTYAEMSFAERIRISHRVIAFRRLRAALGLQTMS